MKILLINPNTTETITERALNTALSAASPGTKIDGLTGHIGAPIINSQSDMAIGTYCAIELAATHANNYDAILLAVSFDCGLYELREMLPIPVAGLSESAMRLACKLGDKFSLLSFGSRTKILYENLAAKYGMQKNLASVRCIETLTPAQINCSEFLVGRVRKEIELAIVQDKSDICVLAATVLSGIASQLNVDIPVVDGIAATVEELEASATETELFDNLTDSTYPENKPLHGVSDELKSLFTTFPEGK